MRTTVAAILGVSLIVGLVAAASIAANGFLEARAMERSVTVKGLSEREYVADIVLWPIQFTAASNDLDAIYQEIEASNKKIVAFLLLKGVNEQEISTSAPAIVDKLAQRYGGGDSGPFRYTATQTITVYSEAVADIRNIMSSMAELGQQGIVLNGDDYNSQPDYIFTRLNEIKPEMIEEATVNAREVAQKFAEDSQSTLGKIKRASQGQFSISARDRHNPHLKNIRVVSTVEYYLSD